MARQKKQVKHREMPNLYMASEIQRNGLRKGFRYTTDKRFLWPDEQELQVNWWVFELNISGILVGIGALGALIYELVAVFGEKMPTISFIVRNLIRDHYILSSAISAVFVGFLFFLFLDWFKLK